MFRLAHFKVKAKDWLLFDNTHNMKTNIFYLMAAGLVISILSMLSGCDNDTPPDLRNDLAEKLKGNWRLQEVTFDGMEQAGYDDFEITLAATDVEGVFSYETGLRPPVSPWMMTGLWEFSQNYKTEIIRDGATEDELVVSYKIEMTTLNEKVLTLRFLFNGPGYEARTASASGQWKFVFIKNE